MDPLPLLAWFLSSFLMNNLLKKKDPFLKGVRKPSTLLGLSFLLLIIHQTTSVILNAQEFTFFVLSLIFFGVYLFSLSEKIKEKVIGQRREKAEINKIAAESQLRHIRRNKLKDAY